MGRSTRLAVGAGDAGATEGAAFAEVWAVATRGGVGGRGSVGVGGTDFLADGFRVRGGVGEGVDIAGVGGGGVTLGRRSRFLTPLGRRGISIVASPAPGIAYVGEPGGSGRSGSSGERSHAAILGGF